MKEVLERMERESGCSVEVLRIDGGVTRSDLLSQLLADALQVAVEVSADSDLTARGAAYLAGLEPVPLEIRRFEPQRTLDYKAWQAAQLKLL